MKQVRWEKMWKERMDGWKAVARLKRMDRRDAERGDVEEANDGETMGG